MSDHFAAGLLRRRSEDEGKDRIEGTRIRRYKAMEKSARLDLAEKTLVYELKLRTTGNRCIDQTYDLVDVRFYLFFRDMTIRLEYFSGLNGTLMVDGGTIVWDVDSAGNFSSGKSHPVFTLWQMGNLEV